MSARSDVRAVVNRHAPRLVTAELRYLRTRTSYGASVQSAFARGDTELPRASAATVRDLRRWRTQARRALADVQELGDSKARELAVKAYRDLDGAITALLPTMTPGPDFQRQLALARRGFARHRRSLKAMNGYLS